MTSKEIWTIDDIIEDYENKGIAGRSKQDFLESVKKDLERLEKQDKILKILKERLDKLGEELQENAKSYANKNANIVVLMERRNDIIVEMDVLQDIIKLFDEE